MKREWNRIFACTLILGLTVLSTGCGTEKPVAQAEEQTYVPVEVEPAAVQTLVETTSFSGKVVSDKEVSVTSKMPGKVNAVNVEVGDWVDAGTVLFTQDTSDYDKNVEQASIAIQTAEKNYLLAKDALEQKQKDFDRQKQLFEAGAISQVELDAAESAIFNLQTQLDLSQINVDNAKISLAKAQQAINDMVTTAPSGGTVTAVNIKYGEMASSGMTAVTITNLKDLYVSLNVPENIVNSLKVGQKATVKIVSAQDKEIDGKVKSIAPSANPQTKLYEVKVSIPNPENLIKPGMFANVEIPTKTKANVLTVKTEAVVLEDGVDTVFVVEEDKAVAKEITTGMDTGDHIEITKGLEAGAQVIIKGQTLVEDGITIKVVGGSES